MVSVLHRWIGLSLGVLLLGAAPPVLANRVQELASQASELAEQGYLSSAVEVYQRAIALDSEKAITRQDASLHFNLALLWIEGNEADKAVTSLERVIQIKPDHVKGHFNLGLLYADKGKKAEAQKELSIALALASGNAKLANYILETLEDRNLMDKNSSGVVPASLPSPSSNSNTAPPVKTAP